MCCQGAVFIALDRLIAVRRFETSRFYGQLIANLVERKAVVDLTAKVRSLLSETASESFCCSSSRNGSRHVVIFRSSPLHRFSVVNPSRANNYRRINALFVAFRLNR